MVNIHFLNAIASPSTNPCRWILVSDFGCIYRIYHACELVMYGVVNVLFCTLCGECPIYTWCGESPVWWMSSSIIYYHMMWWMSGVVKICVANVVQLWIEMYPCSTKTREVLGNPSWCPRDFPRPEIFPEGEARGKSRRSREISKAEGMDFPILPEFWWSTDTI